MQNAGLDEAQAGIKISRRNISYLKYTDESESVLSLSRVRLFAAPWTIQSMEFSRPEYWSWLPCPLLEDLPDPGIEPRSPALQADSLLLSHQFSSVQLLSPVRLPATP